MIALDFLYLMNWVFVNGKELEMLFKVNHKTVNIHPFENERGYHAQNWHIQVTKSDAEKLIPVFNGEVRGVVLANEKSLLGKYYSEVVKIKDRDKLIFTVNKNFLVIEGEDYQNFRNAVTQLIAGKKELTHE